MDLDPLDPRTGLAFAEASRRKLWRGMVVNRWVHIVAIAFNVVAATLSFIYGSRWWMVEAGVVVALIITQRMYVARMSESDVRWQESIRYWTERCDD